MKFDDVYFEWESAEWLALDDAVAVCELMLDLVRRISELPLSQFEVRFRDVDQRTRRGRDLAELRVALAGRAPEEVEQLDYLVSQPELPRLNARLRLRRWGGQGTVLMVRGTHARTVYDLSAQVMELVRQDQAR